GSRARFRSARIPCRWHSRKRIARSTSSSTTSSKAPRSCGFLKRAGLESVRGFFAREIVDMLVVVDGAARHGIALTGPGSQVDHLAALRAERPMRIARRRVGFAFTG